MFLLLNKVVSFLNCCRGMRDFALRALKHLQLPLKSSLEAAPLSARGSIIGHGWEKNSVCSLPGLQMHHPEQGTPLWPDYLFPCLILPNKREDRKEIREEHQSQARSAPCALLSQHWPPMAESPGPWWQHCWGLGTVSRHTLGLKTIFLWPFLYSVPSAFLPLCNFKSWPVDLA